MVIVGSGGVGVIRGCHCRLRWELGLGGWNWFVDSLDSSLLNRANPSHEFGSDGQIAWIVFAAELAHVDVVRVNAD